MISKKTVIIIVSSVISFTIIALANPALAKGGGSQIITKIAQSNFYTGLFIGLFIGSIIGGIVVTIIYQIKLRKVIPY